MDITIQLICIIASFIYGAFIKLLILFHMKKNSLNNIILKFIIDILFVFIIVILYIDIIYKINKGVFHLYFFVIMLTGYITMSKCVKFTKILQFRLKTKINK